MYLFCSNKDTFTNIYKCYLPSTSTLCSLHLHTACVCVGEEWPQNFTFNFLLSPSKAQKCSFKTCTLRHLPRLSLLLFSQVPPLSLRSVLSQQQTGWLSQEIYPWNDIHICAWEPYSLTAQSSLTQPNTMICFFKGTSSFTSSSYQAYAPPQCNSAPLSELFRPRK